MSAKYTVTTTDTTVTIRERGVSGTLTFGVGGPIAAKTVADLAEEVNGLETELAALRRVTLRPRPLWWGLVKLIERIFNGKLQG